mgnify:CR=1 FL=1
MTRLCTRDPPKLSYFFGRIFRKYARNVGEKEPVNVQLSTALEKKRRGELVTAATHRAVEQLRIYFLLVQLPCRWSRSGLASPHQRAVSDASSLRFSFFSSFLAPFAFKPLFHFSLSLLLIEQLVTLLLARSRQPVQ